MWSLHHQGPAVCVCVSVCVRAHLKSYTHAWELLHSCARWGFFRFFFFSFLRDPAVLPKYCTTWFFFFFFSGSAASVSERSPGLLIVTWAAEGNNCSSSSTCFCASLGFCSPSARAKRGKNRYQVVRRNLFVLCLCRSKRLVLLWGPGGV